MIEWKQSVGTLLSGWEVFLSFSLLITEFSYQVVNPYTLYLSGNWKNTPYRDMI
jgi:hypothetical protein